MSDNSYKYVDYGQTVHYKDKSGNFSEIDNSLIGFFDGTRKGLQNKSGYFKVNFLNNSKENDMVSFKFKDYEISWKYEDALDSSPKSVEMPKTENEFVPKNLSSQVIYKNIFSDVDVSYYTNSSGVKEEVILNSASAKSEYIVKYNMPNLTAEKRMSIQF